MCELKRGQSLIKKNSPIGDIPVVSGGKEPAFYTNQFNRDGETITVAGSGSAGYVMFWNKPIFVADAFSIKPKSDINLKYIYYFLANMQNDIYRLQTIGGVPHIYPKDVAKIVIPIPPIRVQTEIVRILDMFSELISELSAELELRKKQYYYYREKLLRFTNDTAEFLPLGEVAEYITQKIPMYLLDLSNYVGVENLLSDKRGKINAFSLPKADKLNRYDVGDILIGNIRPYLKKIYFAEQSGGANGDVLIIRKKNENILDRFLYHLLADDKFFEYDNRYARGGKMPRGDKIKIMEYPIPIPPIEEQERIVAILDKFDILVNSISEGIPAEINLRQKQYEYYRNALLSFN